LHKIQQNTGCGSKKIFKTMLENKPRLTKEWRPISEGTYMGFAIRDTSREGRLEASSQAWNAKI
jgi:hypothetical protein